MGLRGRTTTYVTGHKPPCHDNERSHSGPESPVGLRGHHKSFAKPPRHVTGAAKRAPAGWHALASPSLHLLYQSALHPTVKKERGEGAVLVIFWPISFAWSSTVGKPKNGISISTTFSYTAAHHIIQCKGY